MRKTQPAPRIRPESKGKFVTCSFRIERETYDQLSAYSAFISSNRSYVIREALKLLFKRDRAFQTSPLKPASVDSSSHPEVAKADDM